MPSLSLSLKAHPISFFREELRERGVITSAEHEEEHRAGRYARVAGLVLVRQQPGTAKGVIFITLEDETGIVNVVVWPKVFERNRRTVMSGQFLEVRGKIERNGLVIHVIANELVDHTSRLRVLGEGEAALPDPEKPRRGIVEASQPGFPLMKQPHEMRPAIATPKNAARVARWASLRGQDGAGGDLPAMQASARSLSREPHRAVW